MDNFEKLLHARSGMAFFLVSILALLLAWGPEGASEEIKTLAIVAVTWLFSKKEDTD